MKYSLVSSTLVSLAVLVAASGTAYAGPERAFIFIFERMGLIEGEAAALRGARLLEEDVSAPSSTALWRGSSEFGRNPTERVRDWNLDAVLDASRKGSPALKDDGSDTVEMLTGEAALRKAIAAVNASATRANVNGEATAAGRLLAPDRLDAVPIRPHLDPLKNSVTNVSSSISGEAQSQIRDEQSAKSDEASKRRITFNPLNGELKFGDIGKLEGQSWEFSLEGKTNVYLMGAIGLGAYYCTENSCIKKVVVEGLDDTLGLKNLLKVLAEGKPKSVIEAD